MKILIVEDEPDMAEVISVALIMQWADCQVLVTAEGERAIDLVEQEHPDLVLLDIALPGMDGYAVCSQLREFSDVPVIMLTVRDAEADKVRGLELGADDYVTKPFSHLELLARIRAVLRRAHMPLPAPRVPDFVCGRLAMHFAQRQVTVDGKPVKLTPTEYNLLYHLVRNAGQVLPHSTLLAKVWGHEYKDELDYLKVYIRRLREKLEEDPKNPHYILTARGIGYRFVKT